MIYVGEYKSEISNLYEDEAKSFYKCVQAKITEVHQHASTPKETAAGSENDILSRIEKLGELKVVGVLTEEEFEAKKKDLLSRL